VVLYNKRWCCGVALRACASGGVVCVVVLRVRSRVVRVDPQWAGREREREKEREGGREGRREGGRERERERET